MIESTGIAALRPPRAGAAASHGLARYSDAFGLLHRHVLEAWFPRCIDRENGGFLCDFDYAWRPVGPQFRMLEFQARQTRVAALALRMNPDSGFWRDCCLHGWRFLSEVMWDREEGGFFRMCDAGGSPMFDGDKHAHGDAYAIQACLDAATALDLPAARTLALEAFAWTERHAWDEGAAAYHGWYRRDGRRKCEFDRLAGVKDHLGVPAGMFDANVCADMLETLSDLVLQGFDARDRLASVLGRLEMLIRQHQRLPEWFDQQGHSRAAWSHGGRQAQCMHRLPRARRALGSDGEPGAIERLLFGQTMPLSRRRGGIRSPFGGAEWWSQFEFLRANAYCVAHSAAGDGPWQQGMDSAWQTLMRFYLDPVRRGFFLAPASIGKRRGNPKGSVWKDGSHEAFAFAELLGVLA